MPTVTEYWMLLREVLLTVPPWQGVLLTVALSLVVAKLVELGGKVAIPRLTRSIEGEVDDVIFRTIHAPSTSPWFSPGRTSRRFHSASAPKPTPHCLRARSR
ncbi:hypothetical protein [Haladaptatus sp. GCM10025893]|uniref:hypothetical protein n=1 Tax=Haladaptatus sp. GCM10025893 TaxID=3252659 RepID=UPI00360E8DBF